jgi:hypothetical protein
MITRWADSGARQDAIRAYVKRRWKGRAWKVCLIYVGGSPRPDSPEIEELLGKRGWGTVPAKYVIEGFPAYVRLSVWIFENRELCAKMYKAYKMVGSVPFDKLEME